MTKKEFAEWLNTKCFGSIVITKKHILEFVPHKDRKHIGTVCYYDPNKEDVIKGTFYQNSNQIIEYRFNIYDKEIESNFSDLVNIVSQIVEIREDE